jgi:transposase
VISKEMEADILRLHHAEGWPPGTIAAQLGLHHDIVDRVLEQDGQLPTTQVARPSIVDPYLPFMHKTLKKYPKLTSSRLHEMVRGRGYPGGPDHFRHIVADIRPRKAAEAYLRLRTLAGEQAQVDWGHFGKVSVGRAQRILMCFVMVLSWSRMIFLRFFYGAQMENFHRGHIAAFSAFGGVPREILYDNLKSAVLERIDDAIRFHPQHLALAGHYRFKPKPVGVYRGNEKGRVERAIRYVRQSFFAARKYADLHDLNNQAESWATGIASDRRCPEDETLRVREAFEQEKPKLLPLPENPFETQERIAVRIGKTPYARFDLNDYSVPHTRVKRQVTVLATLEKVRVVDGNEVIAEHPRSFSRREQIEDIEHIAKLREHKSAAKKHRAIDRLHHTVPASKAFLECLAERGDNLGSATATLMHLLESFGAKELESAMAEALERGSPSPHSVQVILDQRLHKRQQPPPIAVPLTENARARDVSVTPHNLADYDPKFEAEEDDHEQD